MAQLPTVLDVGRAAGVSRQTVSNVLNAPELVRPATRERVEAAIAKLGYRPHASARRLRTQKSSTLGIRLDPMQNGISGSVLDRFLHALTEQADARGLRVLLFTARDPQDEIRQYARLRDGADVDAFVLTSTFHGDPRTEWLIHEHIPFVTFGRPWGIDDLNDPSHAWVDIDGAAGVRAATDSLLAAGYRRVAYIGWPAPSGTGEDRRRGWVEAMTRAGGPAPGVAGDGHPGVEMLDGLPGLPGLLRLEELEELEVVTHDGVQRGREAVGELQARGTRFDAVVCASDSLALGAVLATAADVPVIGFDDTPVAEAVGFSSVEQPLDDVAAGILDLLSDHSEGSTGADPRHRLVTPRLRERDRPSQGVRSAP